MFINTISSYINEWMKNNIIITPCSPLLLFNSNSSILLWPPPVPVLQPSGMSGYKIILLFNQPVSMVSRPKKKKKKNHLHRIIQMRQDLFHSFHSLGNHVEIRKLLSQIQRQILSSNEHFLTFTFNYLTRKITCIT